MKQFRYVCICALGASFAAHAASLEWQAPTSATSYEVRETEKGWTFHGELPAGVDHWDTMTAADAVGEYTDYIGQTTQLRYEIRLYRDISAARFAVVALSARKNDVVFPRFTQFPSQLSHLSFDGNFGVYSYSTLGLDAPWLYFDKSGASFLLSPGANFVVASQTLRNGTVFEAKVGGDVKNLPAGHRHETWLVTGGGPNATFDTWGEALRKEFGKSPGSDSEPLVDKLGYWTDRGGGYYYEYESSLGYEGTLLEVNKKIEEQGVKLGYLQLDSWWYPKGASAGWDKWHILSGIHTLRAAKSLFPKGLADFHQRIGVPLAVHSRWIDSSSPYRTRYKISGNVSVDDALWQDWMKYLAESGVVTYEQDWLSDKAHSAWTLQDPKDFLGGMSRAAAENGLNIQYCMPLPRHFLASLSYPNVTTIRTSNDRFERSKWKEYIYGGRLAKSLALRPWSDVFRSYETDNFVLSLLAGGITGVGDTLNELSGPNLRMAARADGRLVRSDSPLMPLDRIYLEEARGEKRPLVAAARTDYLDGTHVAYVFAYNPWSRTRADLASFTAKELGFDTPVVAWAPFQTEAIYLAADKKLDAQLTEESRYFVVSPVNEGVAVLGDRNKFVSMGRARVANLAPAPRGWAVDVDFAQGEETVTLAVWSGGTRTAPVITADGGASSRCRLASGVPVQMNVWDCDVKSAHPHVRIEAAE